LKILALLIGSHVILLLHFSEQGTIQDDFSVVNLVPCGKV